MSGEKRKWRRKPIGTEAFIYAFDGQGIGPCQVKDVSQGGAMLVRPNADELPRQFVLSLSRDGRVRRHCQVVWQSTDHIGVRFTETGVA
jgi:hypothetical protein